MVNRILGLIKERGITAKKLTSDLKISNSSVSDWKKGSKPSCDVVVRLSEYFEVSTDYILLGKQYESALTPSDVEWLSLIHALPAEAQTEFKGELKGYLKRFQSESS
ncbi:MAG: helix-turn-helix domain-containing protein [Lachnospiraceae bacterium]